MNVKLIRFTPDAMDLLLRTKNTRLGFDSPPESWPEEKKAEHLAYMRDTIKSSWEFVDYIFEISGVSRSFTHQLVRTRAGAYAQESQRTVDVSDNDYLPLQSSSGNPHRFGEAELYRDTCDEAFKTYKTLLECDVPAQDAREVLPTATLTSITCKFNLRTLHEMAKVRLCTRTQGQYQQAFRLMRQRVIEVHPWVATHRFVEVHCVSEGTCAFPRFGKTSCKFYDPRMDLDALKEGTHAVFWASAPQEAVPIARDGKTM